MDLSIRRSSIFFLLAMLCCLAPARAQVPAFVGGEGTLSGTISTPEQPAGSSVTVAVSTGYFRAEAVSTFTFEAQGTSFNYSLTLPAYTTYYLIAFEGVLGANGPPPGAPIGVYGNYAPVYIASGAAVPDINFTIAADTQPPLSAITSVVAGSTITALPGISGTAFDAVGVDSLEIAARDVTTGLWWNGPGGQVWVSTDIVPLFYPFYENFQGAPDAPAWAIGCDTGSEGPFNGFSSHLAAGHIYKLYLRAKDFTGNIQQTGGTAVFTWAGPQGDVAPNYVQGLTGSALGISSVSWTWQAVIGANGYAVTSSTGIFLSSVTAASFIITKPGPNAPRYVCVAGYNVYGTGPRTCPPAPVYTLAAVPGVSGIVAVSSYSLTVKWGPGGNPAGTLYELSGSTADFQGGISTSVIVGSGTGDIYVTVPGLSPATTYYVKVRAINGDSITSAYNASLSVKTFSAPPEAPVNLAAAYNPAAAKVSVFWSPAAAGVPAVSFNMYRSAEPDPAAFYTLGSTASLYFDDYALYSTTFYYSIAGLNSDGVEGARSAPFRLVVDADPPCGISDLQVSSYPAADNSALLSWTAPYDNTAPAHYLIKAGLSPVTGGNWGGAVVVGTTAAAVPIGAVQSYSVPVYSTETLKFFAVQVFDAAGNASPVSNSAVLDLLPPSVAVGSPLQPDVPVTRPFYLHIEASDNYDIDKVEFLADNIVITSAVVRSAVYTSDYLWDIGAYSDGNHVFTVKVYDLYGNAGQKQFPALVNYTPPAAPVISLPADNFFVAGSTIAVAGSAEPGTYVSVFVNDAFAASVEVNSAGFFYAAAVPLGGDGAVSLAAQAVDAHGASPRSAGIAGVVDTGPPGAPVSLAAQPGAYGKVALSWSAPDGETPASYNLYRSTLETVLAEGGAPSETLRSASGIKALEFADTPFPDGVYYYAAASVDAAVNLSTLSNVAAAVSDSQPPAAALTLPGRTPPLGAGSYRLELAVSEVLSEPPYLVFAAPAANPAQIALAPSSPYVWAGTLTITQAMASGTGYFTFQGVDLTGNAGNSITAGSALELMTDGPAAEISFDPPAGPALKAGAYALTLALSHAAASAPELYFSVDSGSRAVALSSATGFTGWRGVIAVDQTTGEGLHNLTYSALDTLGNTGTLMGGATYFIADTLATGAPVSLHWSNGPGGLVNLAWSAPLGEKPLHYCVYRDSALVTCAVTPKADDFSGAYSETPSESAHDYYVTALDAAANESAAGGVVQAVADNTPPAAPQLLSAVAEASSVALSWAAGGGEPPASYRLYRATYSITSTAGLTYRILAGAAAADTPARDGVYHYVITALDLPGNQSALSNELTVSYDAAAPEITITGVQDGAYYNAAVQPVFAAVDLNLAASSALLNNAAFASGAAVAANGAYTLTVNASDALGHAASKTVGFTIDQSSPVITLAGITAGGVYTSTITPAISAADTNLAAVTALLNGRPYAIGSAIAESGSCTLQITAVDRAGNASVLTTAFTLDLPPRKVASLAAVIDNGAALALSWTAYAGDLAGYKIYKDGVYLGPVNAGLNALRDTAYSPALAHVYEVAAVDSKGREGARARAEIPAVTFTLAGYGNYAGAEQALNRGFFDAVRFTVTNNGAQGVQAGPVSLTAGAEPAVTAPAVSVAAGAAAEIAPVVYTSTASAASIAARAELTLPQGGDAAISAVTAFTMAVRDPAEPIVEIFPDALVRGAYAGVKVKFNNRGSAPADIITANLAGSGIQTSSDVVVELKTEAGLTLSHGELTQTDNASVVLSNGVRIYFIEVPPGNSYIFEPIMAAVPETAAQALTVEGTLSGFANSFAYAPRYSGAVFKASKSMATELAVPYTATIYSDKPVYDGGTPVKLSGKFKDIWGNLLAGFPLAITVTNKGYSREFSVVTDSAAEFNLGFTPASGEAGVFDVSVRHPEFVGEAAHSSFTVAGMKFGLPDYTLTIAQGSSYSFDVEFLNTGEIPLEGFNSFITQTSGSGVSAVLSGLPAVLGSGLSYKLQVFVTAQSAASATAELTLHIGESHGFERTMPIHVKTVPAQVIPKITPQTFELGMLAGTSQIRMITVANVGFSTWTNVHFSLPTLPWVTVDGMTGLLRNLGDIPPGSNVSFTLKIEPPAGLLNSAYAQNPLLELVSDNFAAVPVNAGITVTSSKFANVYFNVTNADKQPLDATRFIGGAIVTLTSLDIYGMKLTAKTDANGFAPFQNVPSGKYAYRVESTGAQPGSGTIDIEPGLDKTVNVLIPTSMVTYKWSVTPTAITDKYDLTLDMTFRTDVPAPALVITPPLVIVDMEGGQTVYTQYAIENKGLVSAFNFKIEPINTDAIKIDLPFTVISEITPGQRIIVPVKITLAHASCEEAQILQSATTICAAGVPIELQVEPFKIKAGTTCGFDDSRKGEPGITGTPGNYLMTYTGGGGVDVIPFGGAASAGCGLFCRSDGDCPSAPNSCDTMACVGGSCTKAGSKPDGTIIAAECENSLCANSVCRGGMAVCEPKSATEKQAVNTSVTYTQLISKCSVQAKIPPITIVKDGCTIAPDQPIESFDAQDPTSILCDYPENLFRTPGCDNHDANYQTCGASKTAADTQLKTELFAACNGLLYSTPGKALVCKSQCLTQAKAIYEALDKNIVWLPKYFYGDDQVKACDCCP